MTSVKRLALTIAAMNALAPDYERLSDDDIKAKAEQFKAEVKERLGDADPAEPDYKQRVAEAPRTGARSGVRLWCGKRAYAPWARVTSTCS